MTDSDDTDQDRGPKRRPVDKAAASGRRHRRLPVDKAVSAVVGGQKHSGRLKDISASGVAIQTDAEIPDDEQIDIEIEDMEELTGHVTRTLDDGYAVEFDFEKNDEDYLLDEISALENARREEEM